jgi:hypothetical protein
MRALPASASTEWIRSLVDSGGPVPAQYGHLEAVLEEAHHGSSGGRPGLDMTELRRALGPALSAQTLQGFALSKPRGYAGDFEIIDRIYLRHVTAAPHLRKWDLFFHETPATSAVRNRKEPITDRPIGGLMCGGAGRCVCSGDADVLASQEARTEGGLAFATPSKAWSARGGGRTAEQRP